MATQTSAPGTPPRPWAVNVEGTSSPAHPQRTSSSCHPRRSVPAAVRATSRIPRSRSVPSPWRGRMTMCNMSIEAGARAAWSPRRDHLRIHQGAASTRPMVKSGTRQIESGRAAHRRRRRLRQGNLHQRRRARASSPGVPTPGQGTLLSHAVPSRTTSRTKNKVAQNAPSNTWEAPATPTKEIPVMSSSGFLPNSRIEDLPPQTSWCRTIARTYAYGRARLPEGPR